MAGVAFVTAAAARFPFSSVVGQDDAKLALILVAIDPLIGGVLLRGEKGSAKTTLARGMAGLLSEDAPFVELPLGATEDRLIGTLDIGRALVEGDISFSPGLLAEVDRGVLYVDEVNLLADHLVDTLLDVAVSGHNRVEREGLSHEHPSRFVLVGSMNPEEGELRPQLLDRFGLSVSVAASLDIAERVEAVRRRLAFDSSSAPADRIDTADSELATRLATARSAEVSIDVMELASRVALAVGAEGLRADLVLCRAAAAYAGWDGRAETTDDDVRRVAPLVLGHRSRRNPFDPPTMPRDDINSALDDALDDRNESPDDAGEQPDDAPHDAGQDRADEQSANGDAIGQSAMSLGADRQPPPASTIRPRPVESARGRAVRTVEAALGTQRPIAVASSARRLAERRRNDPDATASPDDLRHSVREQPPGNLIVLAVDVSGSMGATERAEAATGTALGLLTDAYQRRDHVAVVAFAGDDATVELAPTASVEVARNRLAGLRTGGATPLAAGIRRSLEVITRQRDAARQPLLVLMSDGRATGGANAVGNALEDALVAAAEVARHKVRALVIDCETGLPRIGLAGQIAEAMGAQCVDAHDLEPRALASLIRDRSLEGSS